MANDTHPADDLAKAFQGLFEGSNVKQALRDAWDRHFGAAESKPSADPMIQKMNKDAMDKTAQDAAKSFITPDAAANIRAKASKVMGK